MVVPEGDSRLLLISLALATLSFILASRESSSKIRLAYPLRIRLGGRSLAFVFTGSLPHDPPEGFAEGRIGFISDRLRDLNQLLVALRKQVTCLLHTPFGYVLERGLFSLIFILSGPNHFAQQTIAFAASQGVPLASLAVPVSGVIALLGGMSVLLGYRAKTGAWLIALFLIGVTPMHKFWGIADPMMAQIQMAMFFKNLSMIGSALLISQFGAGPLSLDTRR